ncbi:MAG: sel1 repeat family protein [Thermoguttaceae bacterium]|nr:sel1 repeat family protein [Thermoguttaceae bacterium]
MAQFNLASCYYTGQGTPQNKEEAVKWWHKAAEQGHVKAQFNLGQAYSNGDGVDLNIEEAVKWYRKAAEQGEDAAIEILKTLEEK